MIIQDFIFNIPTGIEQENKYKKNDYLFKYNVLFFFLETSYQRITQIPI